LIVQVAAYLPMALGIAGCIVLTGTDLSAGRAVGLTAAITGAFLQRLDYPTKMFKSLPQVTPGWMIVTILGVIAVGAIIGLVNGFFVAKFSLHPFIVTLSTQLITFGIILWFFDLNGNNGAPIGGLDDLYKNFLGKTVFYMGNTPIPMYVIYAILLTALMWFIWNKTVFGKNMFAVGSNADAAKVSGVNVFLTTVLVHTLAGAMYGYSGFVEGFRSGSIAAGTGATPETPETPEPEEPETPDTPDTPTAEAGVFDFTNPETLTPSVERATVEAGSTQGAGVEAGEYTFTNGNVTVKVSQGAASTAVRFWTRTGGDVELRTYKNSTITISVSEGTMSSIVFEGGKVGTMTADTGSFSNGTWSGDAQSVTFSVTGTLNVTKLTVK
jgi:ribose/xylose/arabinose/galactoside ABC-type transport system permease subunit